ncbi:MAG: ParB N-terminal domain-containing protein, partial [Patescibacteria group bacterium]
MALKLTNTTDFDGGTPDQMDEMAQDEVVLIALDDIDESDRLRPVDMDFAQAIASSIEKSGLLQPIDICQLPNQKSKKPYRLVAGGHRMEAHRILGHTSIPCFIRSNDADQRRAREIAENL